MYTHVLDQWGIIHDQPLMLNQRQAGAAIEGMVRNTVSSEVVTLAVDTHGYTDFGMALSKLLGFDLCPRLQNLKQRRLHVPVDLDVPDVLKTVAIRDISAQRVRAGWDGLVRVAASIDEGWTSAVLALERFGSSRSGDPTHQAGTELGRLYRTLFLCDYYTNDEFRRRLLRVLNYGESVHALQRTIHFGSIPAARARHREELVAISGSLALLTNLTMAWVTNQIQIIVDEQRRAGTPISNNVLRHIGPVHAQSVNFEGLFTFPIARYSSQLLPAVRRAS